MKRIIVFFETDQKMEIEESLLKEDTEELVDQVAQSLDVDYEDITFICTEDCDCVYYNRDEQKD